VEKLQDKVQELWPKVVHFIIVNSVQPELTVRYSGVNQRERDSPVPWFRKRERNSPVTWFREREKLPSDLLQREREREKLPSDLVQRERVTPQ
jgi:hypothetical protein